jgi:hypothetical protein
MALYELRLGVRNLASGDTRSQEFHFDSQRVSEAKLGKVLKTKIDAWVAELEAEAAAKPVEVIE